MNKVCVKGQRIYFYRPPEPIPKSQVNFSKIEFDMDETWGSFRSVVAQFIQNEKPKNVQVEGGYCFVPSEMEVGAFEFCLRGDDGESVVASVNRLTFEVCEGFNPSGEAPLPPSPDLYTQLIKEIDSGKAIAQSVREDADSGKFNGPPGKSPKIINGNWYVWDDDAKAYVDTGVSSSIDLTDAVVGQSPIIKTVDSDGKPTEWEAAELAKADGSNVLTSARDTWRTRIAALPGVKVYGKADANGKIMAYTDAACTQAANYVLVLGFSEDGNALLIYNHKTYQCVGFSEYSPIPGVFIVAHFSRSEIVTTDNTSVYHVEHAVLDVMSYLSGAIDAPIKITAGDIPLANITTT